MQKAYKKNPINHPKPDMIHLFSAPNCWSIYKQKKHPFHHVPPQEEGGHPETGRLLRRERLVAQRAALRHHQGPLGDQDLENHPGEVPGPGPKWPPGPLKNRVVQKMVQWIWGNNSTYSTWLRWFCKAFQERRLQKTEKIRRAFYNGIILWLKNDGLTMIWCSRNAMGYTGAITSNHGR